MKIDRKMLALSLCSGMAAFSVLAGPMVKPGSEYKMRPLNERKQPTNDKMGYGLITCMQLTPDRVLVLANRNVYPSTPGCFDFEDGCDAFVVGAIDELATAKSVPVMRSGAEQDVFHYGKRRFHGRCLLEGGFVPYEAKLGGKPHPHAGTGFLFSLVESFPIAADGTFNQKDDKQVTQFIEYYELSYADGKLAFKKQEANVDMPPTALGHTGWQMLGSALCFAIPDDADFLMPATARHWKTGEEGAGLVRWKRLSGNWQAVDFTLVAKTTPGHQYCEPTVVRDAKGRLVFASRDCGADEFRDLHAWLSTDGGKTWKHTVHVPGIMPNAPITVGRTAGGQVFLCGSPIVDGLAGFKQRRRLVMWPLADDCRSIGEPSMMCDTDALPGTGKVTFADHPIPCVLRMGDGKLHSIMSHRIRHRQFDPYTLKVETEASPVDGAWVKELTSQGVPIPVWEF